MGYGVVPLFVHVLTGTFPLFCLRGRSLVFLFSFCWE